MGTLAVLRTILPVVIVVVAVGVRVVVVVLLVPEVDVHASSHHVLEAVLGALIMLHPTLQTGHLLDGAIAR